MADLHEMVSELRMKEAEHNGLYWTGKFEDAKRKANECCDLREEIIRLFPNTDVRTLKISRR